MTVLVVAALAVLACRPGDARSTGTDSTVLAEREARIAEAMARPDSGAQTNEPIARWIMPPQLAEISGLELTGDGRLLTHGDEVGRVFEIDYRKGTVVKQFTVGNPEARDDFEAIAAVGDRLFMLNSRGKIYEFREGADGAKVEYTIHDTRLGKECEFEGMAYDPKIQSLVLACKNVGTKERRGSLLLYRWRLEGSGERFSELAIPLDRVIGSNRWKQVRPSDITVDPRTGNYVMVAAQEQALIVVTPSGEVVSSRSLPGKNHPQAEGVAITKDGILIVSDEAPRPSAQGVITLYKWTQDSASNSP